MPPHGTTGRLVPRDGTSTQPLPDTPIPRGHVCRRTAHPAALCRGTAQRRIWRVLVGFGRSCLPPHGTPAALCRGTAQAPSRFPTRRSHAVMFAAGRPPAALCRGTAQRRIWRVLVGFGPSRVPPDGTPGRLVPRDGTTARWACSLGLWSVMFAAARQERCPLRPASSDWVAPAQPRERFSFGGSESA